MKNILRSAIAALTATLLAAANAATFSVTSSTSGSTTTFTVTRSDPSAAETVLYRTVGLGAFAGQHFTAASGTLAFAVGESSKDVVVIERTPTTAAYIYESGIMRAYRFEVTDADGFALAHKDRYLNTGTSVAASSAFAEKSVTVESGTITVTDGGYAQAYHAVPISSYFSSAAPQSFFAAAGAQLRMLVTFDASEKNDGYQYIQIIHNNITGCDTGADGGNPGTPGISRYMAGFEHGAGSTTTASAPYTFPLTSAGDACGKKTTPWSGNSIGNLCQQLFNTDCRASDGRLIIPTDLGSLVIRLNASGSDSDTWYASNMTARIQAVDSTSPAKLGSPVVNPGHHSRGNTFYVSVAFSEPVTISGTPTLSTSWGELAYETGSGSNVLTFKGAIGASAAGTLSVTGYSGTIRDLAGNVFSGSLAGDLGIGLDESHSGPGGDPSVNNGMNVVWRVADNDGDDAYETLFIATNGLAAGGGFAMADFESFASVPWAPFQDSITNVVVGDGVTHVGDFAFGGCDGLEALYLLSLTPPTLGSHALDGIPGSCRLCHHGDGYGDWLQYFANGECIWAVCFGEKVAAAERPLLAFAGMGYYTKDANVKLRGGDADYSVLHYATNGVEIAGDSFTMPGGDVAATASLLRVAGHCGYFYVNHGSNLLWRVSDGDGDGIYEELHITTNSLAIGDDFTMNDFGADVCQWTASRSSVTNIVIGDGVTSIGNEAFAHFTALKSVSIPGSVEAFAHASFIDCPELTSIAIPDSVTYIPPSVFYGCSALASVVIPDNVSSIGQNAFWGCSNLTSAVIPESLGNIGWHAFYGCAGLESLYILPSSPPTLGEHMFDGVPDSCRLYYHGGSYRDSASWGDVLGNLTNNVCVWSVRCGEDIAALGEPVITAAGASYYTEGAVVTLGEKVLLRDVVAYCTNGVEIAGNSFVMPAGDVEVTAMWETVPLTYPAYLDIREGSDNNIVEKSAKANWLAWANLYGADTNAEHEAAFLLNIDPAMSIPEGAALLKVVGFSFTTNSFRLELASDVCNLFKRGNGIGYELCNGYLGVKWAFSLADGAFDQIPPLPVNAEVVDGHAVVEYDYEEFEDRFGIPMEVVSIAPAAFFKLIITPSLYPFLGH